MKLGCIADDFTGATDLANSLVRSGMRVIQSIGVPRHALAAQVDAVVVALKSRTIAPAKAVSESLRALAWPRTQGAAQIYSKYCSTFDSTHEGNIGPVAEALMDALPTDFSIAAPAFPENRRTVFNSHLFVGEVLLSESGMQNHPLTPMSDPNLVRVLQAQCKRKVGLIDHRVVASGPKGIGQRIRALRTQGIGLAVVDALSDEDLLTVASAARDLPLVTGGSGLALGLGRNCGIAPSTRGGQLPAARGWQAVISGSCSSATNRQVARFIGSGGPAFAVDPARVAAGVDVAQEALKWAAKRLQQGPVLIYSTAGPVEVRAAQALAGADVTGRMVEGALAAVAHGLLALGVRQLVVAGGETSGSCVQAMEIEQLQIGRQIDPGVPWAFGRSPLAPDGIHLALKSGNFGCDEFFTRAFSCLE